MSWSPRPLGILLRALSLLVVPVVVVLLVAAPVVDDLDGAIVQAQRVLLEDA